MRNTAWTLALSSIVIACGGVDAPAPTAPTPPTQSVTTASSASSTTPAPSRSTADATFAAISARFLDRFLALRPEVATQLGEHKYDSKWPDLSPTGRAAEVEFLRTVDKELKSVDPAALGVEARVDYAILQNQIGLWLLDDEELKPYETSAMEWTTLIGDGFDPLLTRDYAPIGDRLTTLAGRLSSLDAVVAAAKARLTTSSKIDTETAIQQNKGLIALVATGLDEQVKKAPERKAEVEAAAKKARAALESLQTFLEKDLLPRSDKSFRLGRELYEKKLRLVLDDPTISSDELAASARSLLEETRTRMADTAREVWPLVMKGPLPKAEKPAEKMALVKQVLAKLAEDRPTNATIVNEANALLDEATKFVREKDLVRLPEEACRVIEMPEYRRGVAVAYCDSTGPLETKQESFYAISPTPKDWTKERATSFYKEYNRSMLRDLTVHEAMPGHFLQAMHANRFKSAVRAVYASGPFVEGWAVYTEWVMAQHGFGGPKARLLREKMVLRVATNALLDHDAHAGQLDEKEALAMMKEGALQEDGEAVGKWKRARLTSTQLSTYFYGFREMMRLRMAMEKQPNFKERTYHDALLAHGSPPMRHLRALLGAQ